MVLTMASNMIKRGDEVPPNMTTMLVMELERIRDEIDESNRIAEMNLSAMKNAKESS